MKEKINQMFKDKLFLVMLVLGLLTIVAAAGVATMQREAGEQNPYMEMQDQDQFLAREEVALAGDSDARAQEPETEAMVEESAAPENPDTAVKEQVYEASAREYQTHEARPAGAGLEAATALVLDFTDAQRLGWPVRGNVILDYSMDTTIYFPTLDQYKCNPALVIQGEVSEPVYAPANARVLSQGINEEIGEFLTLDLGNGYTAVCGQLKEVAVVEGEYLEKGQLLGYVAEPTKYYTIEGSSVYFELARDGEPVDPLDYLE
ncbi:MAG: M23 family metallopeptidase [Clostridiales bacterium]|nr:M23 family metallopeptidase [Clostridiales bacterium]